MTKQSPAADVTLRPVETGDWPTIRAWIARPEIASWWGNASAAEAEMRLVAETGPALARIVQVAGAPVGYAHAIDAAHWGSALPDGMPVGTVHLAVSGPGAGRVQVESVLFTGDRNSIRRQSVDSALLLVSRVLDVGAGR